MEGHRAGATKHVTSSIYETEPLLLIPGGSLLRGRKAERSTAFLLSVSTIIRDDRASLKSQLNSILQA